MVARNKLKKPRPTPKLSEGAEEDRREVIKKLGVYGAYTAPALIALLQSGKAVAASPSQFLGG
jgi:hypothetical protein